MVRPRTVPFMATVFLMCGLTFSGKTTVAKRIASEFGCGYLSLDDINEERGLWGGRGIPVEEWERTHEIALARMRERLDRGACVVVDDTNSLRWLRDRFRTVAEEGGHDILLVYVTAPLEEIRQRMAQAERTRERRSVADEVFEDHVEWFEEPGTDESPVVHRSGENVHELLDALQGRVNP